MRLIDPEGEQIGVVTLDEALKEAEKRDLDLVEVAPQANPVVCRIMDYGKYKYKQEKKEKSQHRPQKLKEMKFSPKIEEHDFQTKMRHIKRFLKDGDKVRVTVFFRGREIVHLNRGRELMNKVIDELEDLAKVDQKPKKRGRTIQMLLIPATGGD